MHFKVLFCSTFNNQSMKKEGERVMNVLQLDVKILCWVYIYLSKANGLYKIVFHDFQVFPRMSLMIPPQNTQVVRMLHCKKGTLKL